MSEVPRIAGDGQSKEQLAYCFYCGGNTNNIDLMMLQGHDFLEAVRLLKNWLDQYRHYLGLATQSATPAHRRTSRSLRCDPKRARS